MIFERTKSGEVMALARLLNVTEEELLDDIEWHQRGLKSIDGIDDVSYEHLMFALCYYAKLKADGQAKTFFDIYDDEPDSEDEEEEEPWEKEERDREWLMEREAEIALDAELLRNGYYEREN